VVACVFASSAPARAVPPPPPRAELLLELVRNGQEPWLLDTVRAYQPVPVSFAAWACDRLRLRLKDADAQGKDPLVAKRDAEA